MFGKSNAADIKVMAREEVAAELIRKEIDRQKALIYQVIDSSLWSRIAARLPFTITWKKS